MRRGSGTGDPEAGVPRAGVPGAGVPGESAAGASPDPAHRPLPAALREFLDLYAAGRYWDSHEALEGAWRDSGSPFYQGLILYASAWVHWERRNAHGVRAQLRKALERWEPYPAAYLGLDLGELRRHARSVGEAVAGDPATWADRIEPLPLEVDPRRIRGDEPEAA